MAARWAEILERPVGDDTTIVLDEGEIRFVPDSDGRGEGLGGVDVVTTDASRVIATAHDRHLPADGDTVMAAGVRFRLVA